MLKLLMFLFLLACSSSQGPHLVQVVINKEVSQLRISYSIPREIEFLKLPDVPDNLLKKIKLLNSNLELKSINNNFYIVDSNQKKFKNVVMLVSLKNSSPFHLKLNQNDILLHLKNLELTPYISDINSRANLGYKFELISSQKQYYKSLNDQAWTENFEIKDYKNLTEIFWGSKNDDFEQHNLLMGTKVSYVLKNKFNKSVKQINEFKAKNEIFSIQQPWLILGETFPHDLKFSHHVKFIDLKNIKSDFDVNEVIIKAYLDLAFPDLPHEHKNVHIYNGIKTLMLREFLYENKSLSKNDLLKSLNKDINECIILKAFEKEDIQACANVKAFLIQKNTRNSIMMFMLSHKERDKFEEELKDFYEENSINKDLSFDELMQNKLDTLGVTLKHFFSKLKLATSSLDKNNEEINRLLASKLIEQIYRANCQGDLNVKSYERTIFVAGRNHCEGFVKDFYVNSIHNFHIFRDAFKAYEYARRSCVTQGQIVFTSMSGRNLKVGCYNLIGPFLLFEISDF